MRSKKGGANARRRHALEMLEAQRSIFKNAKRDKESYVTSRNGKPHTHEGRSYESELARMNAEIKTLEARIKP